jgi:hypothetical protein
VPYAIENALFQWEEGERRLREADDPGKLVLERARWEVVAELRRRLGSTFTLAELADLYGAGTDWAGELAHGLVSGTEASWVVDAAFAQYARGASDFGGGRHHPPRA